MPKIMETDPGSTEVQSPLIAGLSEGLSKISNILNMQVGELEDFELENIIIDDHDKNRIYQAYSGHRLWMNNPAPVFKKNGEEIKPTNDGFVIDYVGGSIAFLDGYTLQDEDVVTVSCSYITANSKTLYDMQTNLDGTKQDANRYKGAFNTLEELDANEETPKNGDFAIVLSNTAIYAWKDTEWVNTQSIEDLSNFYDKKEVDDKLATKENAITGNNDENTYYSGKKTFVNIRNKVRDTVLTGLSTATNAAIAATDSVLSAFGKLQAQITNVASKSALTGTSDPTTSTAGNIGQRYINTSNGKWWTLTEKNGNAYTWVEFVPNTRTVNGHALNTNVTVTKADVGLGNADNTSDANKTVSKANQLTTSRTIQTNLASTSSASFNGTANVTPGVTGTLPFANGGTGKTTGKDAANALINSLDTGSIQPVDNDYYIAQYVDGGTSNTTYLRRPVSALWSYIKSKADGIYLGKSANAASASKLATDRSINGTLFNGTSDIQTAYAYNSSGYSNPASYIPFADIPNSGSKINRNCSLLISGGNSFGHGLWPLYFVTFKWYDDFSINVVAINDSSSVNIGRYISNGRIYVALHAASGYANYSMTVLGQHPGGDLNLGFGTPITTMPTGWTVVEKRVLQDAEQVAAASVSYATSAGSATSATTATKATHLPTGASGANEAIATHGSGSSNAWWVSYSGNNNYGGARKYFAAVHADTADSAVDQTARTTANSAYTTANAAMPKSGGTFTGTVSGSADYAYRLSFRPIVIAASAWGDPGQNIVNLYFVRK